MNKIIVRRLLCALAVAASAVLISFRGGVASYMLMWTSLLIPLLALAYRSIIKKKLTISCRLNEHSVLKGERIKCTLIVSNNSAFPITDIRITLTGGKVRFVDDVTEIVCSLKPGEKKDINIEAECLHCGDAVVGAEDVAVQDIFALFEQHFRAVSGINILPRTRHAQDLLIAPVEEAERQRTVRSYFGSTMPDGQLKPYVPGEDVRRIHWKASALQGKPIMRNLVPEPKNEVALLPDSRSELPEGEEGWFVGDSVVEGTLVIADYFLRHGISMRVKPDEKRAVNVSAMSDYPALYRICSADFFKGSERPDIILEKDMESGNGIGIGRYILLTWTFDGEFVQRCSRCIELGSEISVVYIGTNTGARTLAMAETRLGFTQVTPQDDIYSVLAGVDSLEGAAE